MSRRGCSFLQGVHLLLKLGSFAIVAANLVGSRRLFMYCVKSHFGRSRQLFCLLDRKPFVRGSNSCFFRHKLIQ